MATKVVSLKDYRHEKGGIIFDDGNDQTDYYKTLEQNLGFWTDDADDHIFSSQ